MGHGTIECGESGGAHSSVVEVSDLGFGTDGLGDDSGGGRRRRGVVPEKSMSHMLVGGERVPRRTIVP